MSDKCEYYSYVVDVSNDPPYDKQNYRYFTWVGQFVKPIVEKGHHEKYWFTFYGDHGKLRIWATPEQHAELEPTIAELFEHVALTRRTNNDGEDIEKALTLREDLGSDRFRPKDFCVEQSDTRARLVLDILHALCELVIDTLQCTQDGHYFVESNQNTDQNRKCSPYESLHHLFHLITKVPISVWTSTEQPAYTMQQLSDLIQNKRMTQGDAQQIVSTWHEHGIWY